MKAREFLEQLEVCKDVRVSINPSSLRRLKADVNFDNLIREQSPVNVKGLTLELRVLFCLATENLYLWDADTEIHKFMAHDLGLDFDLCIRGNAYYEYSVDSPMAGYWTYGLEDLDWRMSPESAATYEAIYKIGWEKLGQLFDE